MSFKVCQAHDTQQDFGSSVKNARERDHSGGLGLDGGRFSQEGWIVSRRSAKFAGLRKKSGPLTKLSSAPRCCHTGRMRARCMPRLKRRETLLSDSIRLWTVRAPYRSFSYLLSETAGITYANFLIALFQSATRTPAPETTGVWKPCLRSSRIHFYPHEENFSRRTKNDPTSEKDH